MKTIYASLLQSKFRTGHFHSSQEENEYGATLVGDLIVKLRSHGLQYVAKDKSGKRLIHAEPNGSANQFAAVFPASVWTTPYVPGQLDPNNISIMIERGEVTLERVVP